MSQRFYARVADRLATLDANTEAANIRYTPAAWACADCLRVFHTRPAEPGSVTCRHGDGRAYPVFRLTDVRAALVKAQEWGRGND